jgi:hypothetical protein
MLVHSSVVPYLPPCFSAAAAEAAIDKVVDDDSAAEEEKNELVTREMVIAQIKQVKTSIENGLKPAVTRTQNSNPKTNPSPNCSCFYSKEQVEDGDMDNNGVEDINEGPLYLIS